MIASFQPCTLRGSVCAPPSKSMAHRALIGAAMAEGASVLRGVDFSEDILATIDCLRALGVQIDLSGDTVTVDPQSFLKAVSPILPCRESGSTLRFLIPLALCLGQEVTFHGSQRLLERPLTVYEELCREHGFLWRKTADSLTVCGSLQSGEYRVRGDISSQFITGLMFALTHLNQPSILRILPPFESRPYVHLTLAALRFFGADVSFADENTIVIGKAPLHACDASIEGDYSNAAFLDAFNHLGGTVHVSNLNPQSLQGDRVYQEAFRQLEEGTPTLDLSDCPDLGPVLMALAALKNGAVFTGTDRLKTKESDRGQAMHEEFSKLGGGLIFGENTITVPGQNLHNTGATLDSHNDHRIAMALSVILTQTGGSIRGAQAVRKSYPAFFDDLRKLGALVTLSD